MSSDELQLRVQVLEQMVEITMASLLSIATPEQRVMLQQQLAEAGRAGPEHSPLAHAVRRFVGELVVRCGTVPKTGDGNTSRAA